MSCSTYSTNLLGLESRFQETWRRPVEQPDGPASEAESGVVLRAQNGDLAAFERLVDKYSQPLINFASRMLREVVNDCSFSAVDRTCFRIHCFVELIVGKLVKYKSKKNARYAVAAIISV